MEFAFVAPVLFAVVFAFFVVGQIVSAHQVLTHAARAGCRKAALSTTMSTDDVESVVRDYLRRGAIPAAVADAASITVNPAPSNTTSAETTMTVTVSVAFSDVSWTPETSYYTSSNGATLTGSCTMERE